MLTREDTSIQQLIEFRDYLLLPKFNWPEDWVRVGEVIKVINTVVDNLSQAAEERKIK